LREALAWFLARDHELGDARGGIVVAEGRDSGARERATLERREGRWIAVAHGAVEPALLARGLRCGRERDLDHRVRGPQLGARRGILRWQLARDRRCDRRVAGEAPRGQDGEAGRRRAAASPRIEPGLDEPSLAKRDPAIRGGHRDEAGAEDGVALLRLAVIVVGTLAAIERAGGEERRDRELERAIAIGVVEHDEARVRDARGQPTDHHVGGRQLDDREHHGFPDDDRCRLRRPRGCEREDVAAARGDDRGELRGLRRQEAERLGEPLRAPHECDVEIGAGRLAGRDHGERRERRRRAGELGEVIARGEEQREQRPHHRRLPAVHPSPTRATQLQRGSPSTSATDGPPAIASRHAP
jgi:hypothetical protein